MIIRFIISGRVQNVGFRHFVLVKFRMLNINGAVRNLANKDVEVIVETDKEKIELLHDFCFKGPLFSRVDNIKTEYLDKMPTIDESFYQP